MRLSNSLYETTDTAMVNTAIRPYDTYTLSINEDAKQPDKQMTINAIILKNFTPYEIPYRHFIMVNETQTSIAEFRTVA
jgi:hypothetical protein